MTQTLWRHAVTADGRYEKKGTGREESLTNGIGHFDRENLWLVWTNRKGHKLWQCSNVPFTELRSPLFNFPLSHQLTCLLKKMSCPFISIKVALEAATSKGAWAVYHNYCVFMQLGYGEAVSDLATFIVLSPLRLCKSGCYKNSYYLKETAPGVNSLVQCYAGWQTSKKTIWLEASAGHPPHSFVFSLSQ